MPTFPNANFLKSGRKLDSRQLWLLSATMKRGAEGVQEEAERQSGGWGWFVSPMMGLWRVVEGGKLAPVIPPKTFGGWWFDRRQLLVLARGSEPGDVYFLGLATTRGYPISGVVFTPAEDAEDEFFGILWG